MVEKAQLGVRERSNMISRLGGGGLKIPKILYKSHRRMGGGGLKAKKVWYHIWTLPKLLSNFLLVVLDLGLKALFYKGYYINTLTICLCHYIYTLTIFNYKLFPYLNDFIISFIH